MKSGSRPHSVSGLSDKFKMAFVYILQSETSKRFYIGSTTNLAKRIEQHRKGQNKSTKPMLPVSLVFVSKVETNEIARKIEGRLKKLKRRDYIEKIIKSGKITVRSLGP